MKIKIAETEPHADAAGASELASRRDQLTPTVTPPDNRQTGYFEKIL